MRQLVEVSAALPEALEVTDEDATDSAVAHDDRIATCLLELQDDRGDSFF